MAKRKPMSAQELRDYLESMPCPFCTDGISDDELNTISALLEVEMEEVIQWENDGTISHDKASEYETEKLEHLCNLHDIPYYEDL